jgi:hypothetical protein
MKAMRNADIYPDWFNPIFDNVVTYGSFAVGTPNVPYDMQANIHRGEIIVPRDFSDGLRSGDLTMGSNVDVSNKLDRNNAIMSEILRTLKDGNDINNASLEVLEDLERIA